MPETNHPHLVTWPYRESSPRKAFDPNEVELQGREILARAVSHGRLVAFVGSGVSAAYGRPLWPTLLANAVQAALGVRAPSVALDTLKSIVEGFTGMAEPGPDAELQHLQRMREAGRRNPLVVLQLCDAVLRSAEPGGAVAGQPASVQALFSSLLPAGSEPPIDAPDAIETLHKALCGLIGLEERRAHAVPRWRERWLKMVGNAPQIDGVDDLGPLRQLIADFDVRRFATTNYDLEIEDQVRKDGAVLSRRELGASGRLCRSISLQGEFAGDSMVFAAEARRRHPAVLHLHGMVNAPEGRDANRLLITEHDYQQRYMRPGPQRDLMDTSVRLLFGANPLLFVGSGVAEDDVLRPLREMVSMPSRTAERMAVALLPAYRPVHEVIDEKVAVYLQYGIHVLHYGYVGGRAGRDHRKPSWLCEFTEFVRSLRKRILALARRPDGDGTAALGDLAPLPGEPETMEGMALDESTGIRPELSVLETIAAHTAQGTGQVADADQRRGWLWVLDLVDQIEASVMSAWLTAALRAETAYRQTWAAMHTGTAKPLVTRLRDAPFRCLLAPAPRGDEQADDVRWKDFHRYLGAQPLRFRTPMGRRLFLLPVPRGGGKGSLFEALASEASGPLQELQSVLQGDRVLNWQTLLVNLNYLPDVSHVAACMAAFIWPEDGRDAAPARRAAGVLARLEHALMRRAEVDRDPRAAERRLVLISNAGVLFDRGGNPKNGQVLRFVDVLLSPRFAAAGIDFIVLSDEQHLPERFRASAGEMRGRLASEGLRGDGAGEHLGWRSRLLMQGLLRHLDASDRVMVYTFRRSRASELAEKFGLFSVATLKDAEVDEALLDLFQSVDGNRFAITLVLLLLKHTRAGYGKEGDVEVERLAGLRVATLAMRSHLHESTPETAIQFVFDRWRRALPGLANPPQPGLGWEAVQNLLWHLAVISHPVEAEVLARCPDLQAAVQGQDASRYLEQVLDWCEVRGLVMKIEARGRLLSAQAETPAGAELPCRYTVHRMVQRHLFRMIGGRNVEGSEWDRFTTTLHASQPDEVPALTAENHRRIDRLLRALTDYDREPAELQVGRDALPSTLRALRAAYFLARSTYSTGVLSHIATSDDGLAHRHPHGHMEEYRRQIRWITHRLQALEAAHGQAAHWFHPGELVWLYAECGAVSLAQGKLEDAEAGVNLALQAVRRIEDDDTGSLHVRILLHLGLIRLERGRPRDAKALFHPIEARQHGHPMPPLIATYYLGIVDHLGGDYGSAKRRYDKALDGFRRLARHRAAAMVLRSLADVCVALKGECCDEAMGHVRDAISVALRGGHEDVRVLAELTQARLLSLRPQTRQDERIFRGIDRAEGYARHMGMPRVLAVAHEVRASLLLAMGETRNALADASASASIAALNDMRLVKAKALLVMARVLLRRGELAQATQVATAGMEMAQAGEYYSCVRGFQGLLSQLPSALADQDWR